VSFFGVPYAGTNFNGTAAFALGPAYAAAETKRE
jgi:hypothetical protein